MAINWGVPEEMKLVASPQIFVKNVPFYSQDIKKLFNASCHPQDVITTSYTMKGCVWKSPLHHGEYDLQKWLLMVQ